MYFKPDARISDPEYLRTYNIFKYGDIAFEGNKSKSYANGRFVENTIGDGIVSHVFNVLRPLSPTHNLEYWKYAINNENVMGRILARCTKKTTMMTNLVTADFLEQEICCPVELEQDKIASFLSVIEKRLVAQERLVENLKKYKRGVEASFFNIKRNTYKKENQVWDRVPFGDIVTINPKTPSLPEHFIYIDLESVDSGRLQSLKHINRENAPSRAQRVLADGDVLFQMVRPYQKNNYYFRDIFESPVVASTGYAQIRCQRCDPIFVYEQISSDYFSQEAMLRSTGTGYPAINSDGLAEIPFFLPPLSEQKRIGKFLSLLSSKIESEKSKLEIFYRLKAALLQQLFI